jgi:hypothetical protein
MTAFNFQPKKTKANSRHLSIPKMNMTLMHNEKKKKQSVAEKKAT